MRPAFIVIDLQRQFFADASRISPVLSEALEIINYVAEIFRERGWPVIFVQDKEGQGPGHPGFELLDGLQTAPSDHRVQKLAANDFREPPLSELLTACSVDFALLAGFKAEGCVLSTAKGAEDRDLRYALLRGAVLSDRPNSAEFVERICPIMSYHVVEALP